MTAVDSKLDFSVQSTRLHPCERLELLADAGSLHVIRSSVLSQRIGAKARTGDGVIGASVRVAGRPVFCFAQDPSVAGGSVGSRTPTPSFASSGLRVRRACP